MGGGQCRYPASDQVSGYRILSSLAVPSNLPTYQTELIAQILVSKVPYFETLFNSVFRLHNNKEVDHVTCKIKNN